MSSADRFSTFLVKDVTYKTVSSTPIEATILIPKDAKPGKHPVLVRWHGGSIMFGYRLSEMLLHTWVLEYVQKHSVILVCPDFQLLPASTCIDTLEDIKDFWAWSRSSLSAVVEQLKPGVQVDFDKIASIGESSGGNLALQSALLHPEVGVKAVIIAYATLDIASPYYSTPHNRTVLGYPAHADPQPIIDEYLANMAPVCSADASLNKVAVAMAISQTGRYYEFYGKDDVAQPFFNLEKYKGELPYLWAFHGKQDSAVPVEGTEKFERLLKKLRPDGNWKVTYPNGDHMFDKTATLEDGWLKEGLNDVEKYWL